MEAVVTFSRKIPSNANTMEAYDGHVLKCKKNPKQANKKNAYMSATSVQKAWQPI